MNRRYLILAILIILILFGTVAAKTVYSVCEPGTTGCAEKLAYAESLGYINFAYDDAAPFATAGLMCCWWERVYKLSHFSRNADGSYNTNTIGLSAGGTDNSNNAASSSDSDSTSSAQVETKSYCPSCCSTCDDDDPSALKERSDAIMAKKPWLTEGKTNKQPSAAPTVTPASTDAQMVMTFSEAT